MIAKETGETGTVSAILASDKCKLTIFQRIYWIFKGYFRECIRLPSFMRLPAIKKGSTSSTTSNEHTTAPEAQAPLVQRDPTISKHELSK
jgi:hypothetical protein